MGGWSGSGFTTVKLLPDGSTVNSRQKLRWKNQGQSEVVCAEGKIRLLVPSTTDKYRPTARVRVRVKASQVKDIKGG